jgi:hypothetical protein
MRKLFLLAVFVCSISALAQAPPDCSHGFCAGIGTPTLACKAGNKYTQLDAPGTGWSCTGIPPHWVQDSGGGGGNFPASKLALVQAEDFGAVGDWNGTTGTDNTTAIQNAINSLQNANVCGQVLLQNKLYKITGTLNITHGCVGIKGTSQGGALSNVNPSGLVSTSASADMIDVAGASSAALIEYNVFQDFSLQRSVAPTGTATGLSISYVGGSIITRVQVMDSARGFYFHMAPARGVGKIEDCLASWGFGAVTGYNTGTMSGFYLDSADGNAQFSFRGRHLQAANNLASFSGIHGMDVIGTAVQDVMVDGLETASVDIGINVSHTGSTANSGLDLHFNNSILDNSRTSGILVNGVTAAVNGRIEFNGGYVVAPSGTGSAIDIEGSSGVNITNLQLGPEGTAPNWILLNATSSSSVTNNSLIGVTTKAITLTGSTGNTISGNQITGSGASTLINLTSTSTYNAITGNNLQGTATTGMAWDATSINEYGYSTNVIGSGITTLTSNANQPGYEQVIVSEHNGNPTLMLYNKDSAGYPQLGFQNNTAGASAQGGIFLGGTTIASPYTNTLWMFNLVGGLYLRGNGAVTINAGTTGTPATPDLGITAGHVVTASTGIRPPVYTVSTLPSAATLGAGTTVVVSDGAGTPPTCTGSGSNYQIALSNGTTWTCH